MTARRLPMRRAIARHAAIASLRRQRPTTIRRILIAHNLLLGDTLMLTPLLAALRHSHPQARIILCCPRPFLCLYTGRPYGVETVGMDLRDPATLTDLRRLGPYDLAIVPADSRHGWLARAAGARWVRGFAGDNWYYRLALDEAIEYPPVLETVSDLFARLALAPCPGPYDPQLWTPPARGSLVSPRDPYVVLHLGAGSALKYWPAERWRALAEILATETYAVVLSSGPDQTALAAAVDPSRRFINRAGCLTLNELWHLLAQARLLVTPDTGVAHLAKHTLTPTVVLFGPAQQALYDRGRFWAQAPLAGVTLATMPCRNETVLFRRALPWVQTCTRTPPDCHFGARCSQGITVESVLATARRVMAEPAHGAQRP